MAMASITPSGYEYTPSVKEKVVTSVKKRAPFIIGRIIQYILYGLFQVVQFLKQVIVDAVGK
jgi:hypothetical protein